MNLSTQGFYFVKSIEIAENKISAKVLLNPKHRIFEGHFPEQPLVPGVCQIQMVRELAEQTLGKLYRLSDAKQIKFLKFINPFETNDLNFEIRYKYKTEIEVELSASIFDEQKVEFLKMNGIFTVLA